MSSFNVHVRAGGQVSVVIRARGGAKGGRLKRGRRRMTGAGTRGVVVAMKIRGKHQITIGNLGCRHQITGDHRVTV